jgi:hypothetical protein
MMYQAKTLISGYKLGLKDMSLFVGIPKKYWNNICVSVKYGDESRLFSKKKIVKEEEFVDKFKPGMKYTLCYVLWEKRHEQPNS